MKGVKKEPPKSRRRWGQVIQSGPAPLLDDPEEEKDYKLEDPPQRMSPILGIQPWLQHWEDELL